MSNGSRTSDRIDAIDGLRGVAALAVLVFHTYHTTAPDLAATHWFPQPIRLAVAHLGVYAVMLFFVLSGMLVTKPFVRALLGTGRRVDARRYLACRIARIFPAWWFMLLVVVTLGNRDLFGRPWRLLAFATLQQSYNPATIRSVVPHGWSLAVEVTFYAVLPCLVFTLGTLVRGVSVERRAAWIFVALSSCLAAALAFSYYWFHVVSFTAPDLRLLTFSLLSYLSPFVLGALIALLLESRSGAAHWHRIGAAAFGVGIAGWYGGVLLFPRYEREIVPFALATAALGVALRAARRRSSLLASGPLPDLGRVSYGVYLWHLPLLYAAVAVGVVSPGRGSETVPAAIGLAAASVAIAVLSFRYVETPCLRTVQRRFESALPQHATPPVHDPRSASALLAPDVAS